MPSCDRSCAKRLFQASGEFQPGTLLFVKIEYITETENIFSAVMGDDLESRRKFIEENALDVKNLDI